jgi:hypothetical protein
MGADAMGVPASETCATAPISRSQRHFAVIAALFADESKQGYERRNGRAFR